MRKITEKVALVAQICISFILVLLTVLFITGAIKQEEANNQIVTVLIVVLAVFYLGLSALLIYFAFSERLNVRRIVLFFDAESTTRAGAKVVDNIVDGCAKKVSGVKVRKTKLRLDEKLGPVATVYMDVDAADLEKCVQQMRALLVENFRNTLGLKFNAINFEIEKLNKKFTAKDPSAAAMEEAKGAVTAKTDDKAEDKPAEKPADKPADGAAE